MKKYLLKIVSVQGTNILVKPYLNGLNFPAIPLFQVLTDLMDGKDLVRMKVWYNVANSCLDYTNLPDDELAKSMKKLLVYNTNVKYSSDIDDIDYYKHELIDGAGNKTNLTEVLTSAIGKQLFCGC